jgi:acetylornithine/N-succinyldiaminopimelate aminotransferase
LEDPTVQFAEFPLNALMEITARPPLVFVRGEGSWLWDHEGRRYLDFVQGWAVNALGHCPSEIRAALAAQAAVLINPSPAFWNEPSARLAQRLVECSCFGRVFFANSGAEANEGAIKLARKWGAKARGGAYEIITFDHAFHGRTLATMSASGKPGWDRLFEPKVPGFPKATLNDLDSVARLVGPRTVAVMLEPIQGESGVLPATDDFMRALRALTRERGLLLIVDEVQTGIGRTGRMFGYEHAGVEPDVMTLGKGIGGGVPLAALLAKESVCCFEHGDQGGTYNGNPLMTAVGLAVVEALLAPGFLAGVEARGRQLRDGLAALAAKRGLGEVRGRGLLVALDLGRDVGAKVVEIARGAGLLVNSPRPNTLRFMPALNVSAGEIELMLRGLDEAIGKALAP